MQHHGPRWQSIETFSIELTANGKRQAAVTRLRFAVVLLNEFSMARVRCISRQSAGLFRLVAATSLANFILFDVLGHLKGIVLKKEK